MRARTRRLRSACLVMIASCDHHRTDPPAAPTADADDDRQPHRREDPLPLPPRRPAGAGQSEVGRERAARRHCTRWPCLPVRGTMAATAPAEEPDHGGERTPMGPEAQVEAGGRDAAALLGRARGGALGAVYLGGPGAVGGVAAGQSDVDLVAVCAAAPGDELRRAIVDGLGGLAMGWPVRGLEFVLYTRTAVAAPAERPGFELNLDVGPRDRKG